MTTVELPRIDRISARAREVDVSAVVTRAVLTVLAAVLWLVGAIPARLVRGLVWCAVAVQVGYQENRRPPTDRGGGT